MGIGFFLCYNGFMKKDGIVVNHDGNPYRVGVTEGNKVYILPSQECALSDVLDSLVGPKTMALIFALSLTYITSAFFLLSPTSYEFAFDSLVYFSLTLFFILTMAIFYTTIKTKNMHRFISQPLSGDVSRKIAKVSALLSTNHNRAMSVAEGYLSPDEKTSELSESIINDIISIDCHEKRDELSRISMEVDALKEMKINELE